jgi:hypothetical protein
VLDAGTGRFAVVVASRATMSDGAREDDHQRRCRLDGNHVVAEYEWPASW